MVHSLQMSAMNISRESKRYEAQGSIDLNPLMRLKEALEGAQKNTHRILTKLDRFEKRLEDLHSKMKPVQETTDRYSKAKENITATLQEVGKTYEYFRITSSCEPVIKQGLLEDNRTEYFEALTKLSNAKAFFETHRDIRSATSVLHNIDTLFQVLNAEILFLGQYKLLFLSASGRDMHCRI